MANLISTPPHLKSLLRPRRLELYFGQRVLKDTCEIIRGEQEYRQLDDRRECIICSSDLFINGRKNSFHPCCSGECKKVYLDWLWT